MASKTYDIVLFGMTGFTGKLAVEHLLKKQHPVKWAACARSEGKAKAILKEIADSVSQPPPPLVIADLICNSEQDETKLRDIIKSTRVVLTAAGPFEKYAMTLHKMCAEEGVHYADITGETSYVRQIIEKHDDIARKNNAALVSHCGNDCIPHDLTVFEMNEYAKSKGCTLVEVTTLDEIASSASFSGGTLTTAMYQLSKPKNTKSSLDYDPLVKTAEGKKSDFKTIITHKTKQYHKEFGRKAGPWLMAPVMSNCVRRSNALLGYCPELKFGDAMLDDPSWANYVSLTLYGGMLGAALYIPPLRSLIPQPGQGPDREAMDSGWLKLWGQGFMVDNNDKEKRTPVYSLMHFKKDTGYLMTAEMLVETGCLLVEMDKAGTLKGGVLTPAVAFGSELTKRLTKELEVTFDLKDAPMYDSN
ncbi:Trans-acting enoyl reductase [Seminavis robusta]|uniref:Trans-acting enoyl reductase n=1 Tax=Seminavis robusta TaxID=568900 RepID=A0A9N8HH96_9STRA|nr:Trans-acting enoyl reductase [Seminavis robusta]|eukprot:Sro692_g188070.1 Trans-acting enoyl reductase (417) ;mRNA; r:25642-27127